MNSNKTKPSPSVKVNKFSKVAFLERINDAGGVGFIAHSLRDVVRELGPL